MNRINKLKKGTKKVAKNVWGVTKIISLTITFLIWAPFYLYKIIGNYPLTTSNNSVIVLIL